MSCVRSLRFVFFGFIVPSSRHIDAGPVQPFPYEPHRKQDGYDWFPFTKGITGGAQRATGVTGGEGDGWNAKCRAKLCTRCGLCARWFRTRFGRGGGRKWRRQDGPGGGELLRRGKQLHLHPESCDYGSVGVLLGNGDGTFQPAVTYLSGGYYTQTVAVADVNGDGKADILVVNDCTSPTNCFYTVGDGSVSVLLGNGDGTFQPAVAYDSGGEFPSGSCS